MKSSIEEQLKRLKMSIKTFLYSFPQYSVVFLQKTFKVNPLFFGTRTEEVFNND